jgi:hypothetical protein
MQKLESCLLNTGIELAFVGDVLLQPAECRQFSILRTTEWHGCRPGVTTIALC